MSQLSVMYSEKGKILLVLNNFKFRQYRPLKTGEMSWSCTNKNYNAKLYTVGEEHVFSRMQNDHKNHKADTVQILNRQKINNAIKRKADELLFLERPRKIVRQEVEKDVNILNTLTDRDMIRIGK
ncbi:hypothetical protein QTP88_019869 [Uroleucon formosanum]